MDITNNNHNHNNTTSTTTATHVTKTTEAESHETQTPIRIQPVKPISFSNGVLKRHNSLQHQHQLHHHHPVVVLYKECLKNHAASLGGHAVDGCGEFMPSPSANATDPTSLKCAACGCHRNFHRREPEDQVLVNHNTTAALEYQPLHRHHPPPPPPPQLALPPHNHHGGAHSTGSPINSPSSPPPISSAYYPASAPHMLLALSTGGGLSAPPPPPPDSNNISNLNQNLISPVQFSSNPNSRKRFRTKFTQNQKERMLEFAERIGWKIQKRDEDVINEFCRNIGVEKGVLKVWMHNNKNTFGKKSDAVNSNSNVAATVIHNINHNINVNTSNGFGHMDPTTTAVEFHLHHESSTDKNDDSVSAHNVVGTNGSSSSS